MEFRCYLVHKLSYTYLKFTSRRLEFSTSAYILASDKHQYNTSSVSEIMGEAVGIFFLTSVELKLCCMLYAVHKLYLLLPVLSRHFGLVGARLVLFLPSCSPIIFGRSHQSAPYNSKRFKNGGSKCRSGLGSFPPLPISNTRVKGNI